MKPIPQKRGDGMSPFERREPEPMPGPYRYRNDFRWRVMPCDEAVAQGHFFRSFPNKKKAEAYQKSVKALFPDDPCALCDTGKYYDAHGRIYSTKE